MDLNFTYILFMFIGDEKRKKRSKGMRNDEERVMGYI